MLNFKQLLKQQQDSINQELLLLFDSHPQSCLLTAMHYSLMAGGKRIRPILCINAANAVNDQVNNILSVACAIECIHTYSLIHDDLPAMDNDDLRRGNPTCHKAFDEATAILAGDALLTLAFEILSGNTLSNHDPETRLQVIQMVAHAAGPYGMIEGQMQDIASESTQLTATELERLHRLKTGALIAVSVNTGALLAKASSAQKEMLNAYAQNIGLAFQVIDDVLNVRGDAKQMGKAVGTDRENQKNTYPDLMGLSAAEKKAHQLLDYAIDALSIFDDRADPLRSIARYIVQRDH